LVGVSESGSLSHVDTNKALQEKVLSNDQTLYSNYLSGEIDIASGPTMFSRVTPLALNDSNFSPVQSQKSPLSDIPFKLHPVLDAQLRAGAMFDNINLEHSSFDWSKYSHDFKNERISLQDINSDEISDLDWSTYSHDFKNKKLSLQVDEMADLITF
jgi:hypothetical protein